MESHRHPTETDELSNHIFAVYKRLSQGDQTRNVAEITETCGICTASIPWTTVDAATCTTGHRFGQCLRLDQTMLTVIARCSLTFGSIQRPGISKFCGICGNQCLNERKIYVDMAPPQTSMAESPDGPEDSRQLPRNRITLAQVILSAANRCIYCGGKFIS